MTEFGIAEKETISIIIKKRHEIYCNSLRLIYSDKLPENYIWYTIAAARGIRLPFVRVNAEASIIEMNKVLAAGLKDEALANLIRIRRECYYDYYHIVKHTTSMYTITMSVQVARPAHIPEVQAVLFD